MGCAFSFSAALSGEFSFSTSTSSSSSTSRSTSPWSSTDADRPVRLGTYPPGAFADHLDPAATLARLSNFSISLFSDSSALDALAAALAAHFGSSSKASDGIDDAPDAFINAGSASVGSPVTLLTTSAASAYRSLTPACSRSEPSEWVPTSTAHLAADTFVTARKGARAGAKPKCPGSRHTHTVPSAPPVTSREPQFINASAVTAVPCPTHRPTSTPLLTSYTRTVLSACDTAANRPCGSASTRSASPAPSSAQGYALVVLPLAMDQRRRRPSAPAVTHVLPRVSNATPCTTPRGIVSEANALDALEAFV